MFSVCRTLILSAVLLLLVPIVNVSAQQQDPLIGTWILNVEKSQYPAGQAPKSEMRSFDFSHDGMILCAFHRETARGARTFGHWRFKFDGEFYPEFSRAEGATGSMIGLKKIDDRTIDVKAKQNGAVYFTSTMNVSADGKMLTWKIKTTTAQGGETNQVRVYDKQ